MTPFVGLNVNPVGKVPVMLKVKPVPVTVGVIGLIGVPILRVIGLG